MGARRSSNSSATVDGTEGLRGVPGFARGGGRAGAEPAAASSSSTSSSRSAATRVAKRTRRSTGKLSRAYITGNARVVYLPGATSEASAEEARARARASPHRAPSRTSPRGGAPEASASSSSPTSPPHEGTFSRRAAGRGRPTGVASTRAKLRRASSPFRATHRTAYQPRSRRSRFANARKCTCTSTRVAGGGEAEAPPREGAGEPMRGARAAGVPRRGSRRGSRGECRPRRAGGVTARDPPSSPSRRPRRSNAATRVSGGRLKDTACSLSLRRLT